MVFPSLVVNIEPGLVSQLSAWIIVAISYFINRLRKGMMAVTAIILIALALISHAHGFGMAYPQTYQYFGPYSTQTTNYLNYYGQPWGAVPPVYFYPYLPPHSFYGPIRPYYFPPYPVSPYAPEGYDCVFCKAQYYQHYPMPMFY